MDRAEYDYTRLPVHTPAIVKSPLGSKHGEVVTFTDLFEGRFDMYLVLKECFKSSGSIHVQPLNPQATRDYVHVKLNNYKCTVDAERLATALSVDPERVKVIGSHGNLDLLLDSIKEVGVGGEEKRVYDVYLNALSKRVAEATSGKVTAEVFKKLHEYCQDPQNIHEWKKELGEIKNNFRCKYIVKTLKIDSKVWKIEYRSPTDIRVRVDRNFACGGNSVLSRHLDVLAGKTLIKKKRKIVGSPRSFPPTISPKTELSTIKEAFLINSLANIQGIMTHIRPAEFNLKTNPDGSVTQLAYFFEKDMNKGDLAEVLKRKELSETKDKKTLCMLFRDVFYALDRIQHAKVVHKDIKPANLMLRYNGKWKIRVGDFSSAEFQSHTVKTTNITLLYVSPELVYHIKEGLSYGNVGHETDVFSAGISLFNVLTNSVPDWYEDIGNKFYAETLDKMKKFKNTVYSVELERDLQNLIIDMTRYFPQDRITILEAANRLNQIIEFLA
jgi:hypothetical protein